MKCLKDMITSVTTFEFVSLQLDLAAWSGQNMQRR